MKSTLFLLAVFSFVSANGQSKSALELSILGRYDQHAHSVSNFAGRAYNDTNRLYGLSFGVNVLFKQELANRFSLYVGVGYYRLGIDRIRGNLPFGAPGVRKARNIDYDDGATNLLYGTDRYHYNNLALTLGLSKVLSFKNGLQLDMSVEGVGYSTFSQRYRLSKDKFYATKNAKPLEFGVNALAGMKKLFGSFYLQPALLFSVYQNLKGDRVFYEERNMNISKWFGGLGLSLKIGKYL